MRAAVRRDEDRRDRVDGSWAAAWCSRILAQFRACRVGMLVAFRRCYDAPLTEAYDCRPTETAHGPPVRDDEQAPSAVRDERGPRAIRDEGRSRAIRDERGPR